MANKLPSFQFYPGDWMKDTALRFCSTFARGLLVDLLCHMFDAKERGKLIAPNGTPWTREQVIRAIAFGEDHGAVSEGLDELLDNGVIKLHSDGYYYSARMVRDEHIRQERSKAGSKGGSKASSKTKANTQQIPEDEVEEEDTSGGGSAEGGSAFAAFWSAYPRKVGKRNCSALWARRHLSEQAAEIMAGLARCKASTAWSKDGGQFIPNPQTWLNRDGWLDELDSKPARKVDPLAGLSSADTDDLYRRACEQWPDCKAQGRGSDYTRARMAKLARGAA